MAVKNKKDKKEGKISERELEQEVEDIEEEYEGAGGDEMENKVVIKASKPIANVKKGDKIKVDGVEYEVDSHYVLIKHPSNKEMAIEVFDKNDKDFQLRYFDDQVERAIEFYELQGEIMFVKKLIKKVEW